MARRIAVIVGGLLVFALVGLAIPYVMKMRARADVVTCRNNLRELAQFAAHFSGPNPKQPRKDVDLIPPGTIFLPGVPPDERLSWVVSVLPVLDQKRHDAVKLLAVIDEKQPWPAAPNQQAARTKLATLLCPGNPPAVVADQPAPACYVGIGGLGADAAAAADPHRAGCFRYDGPTPFDRIADGLSQTLLFGERSGDLGPWLRGGPSTVRGFDDAAGAPPVLGPGAQFGGNHPTGANWALADGSVRLFNPRVDPKLLFGLATIAGGEKDPLPGD